MGFQEADSPQRARELLGKANLHILELSPVQERGRARSYRPSELCVITKQLATLLRSGLPLARALEVLTQQLEGGGYESIFRSIRQQVMEGKSLAEAIRSQGGAFPPLYGNMVEAGEASGNLAQVLQTLAGYIRAEYLVRHRLWNAFAYPLVMVVVGAGVLVFLLSFVVPKITSILLQAKRTLPLPTKILIKISGFIQEWWMILLLLLVVLVVAWRVFLRTARGRYLYHWVLLSLPVVGGLVQRSVLSRFCLTLSNLLRSGISLLPALKMATGVVGNRVVEEVLEGSYRRIMGGEELAKTLEGNDWFPPLVVQMVAVGEESGQLEELLEEVSEHYQAEIDLLTARILSLLEPILIVVLASVVGFIVLAIVLPILDMSEIAR